MPAMAMTSMDTMEGNSDDDRNMYEVDELLDTRQTVNTQYEFLVKWKNLSSIWNSWVPEEALFCPQLMRDAIRRYKNKRV